MVRLHPRYKGKARRANNVMLPRRHSGPRFECGVLIVLMPPQGKTNGRTCIVIHVRQFNEPSATGIRADDFRDDFHDDFFVN